ncbi:sortase [Candidatus Kaiserbacteria bacterium]|nr:sortase [Candidatus Kaiserbacteria bacterium]
MNQHLSHKTVGKTNFVAFLVATMAIFFLSLSAAHSVGFVPYYVDGTPPRSQEVQLDELPALGENPVPLTRASETRIVSEAARPATPTRIMIGSIGMDLPVQNPSTRDIAKLDELLKDGPARFVDSAKLGEEGNLLVFAHSSHLPIVHNQMYKAFNRVAELATGNVITIRGDDGKNYLYSVTSMRTAKADDPDEIIDLSGAHGTRLTLVTCDTLTGKSARFIIEAEFVGNIGA